MNWSGQGPVDLWESAGRVSGGLKPDAVNAGDSTQQ